MFLLISISSLSLISADNCEDLQISDKWDAKPKPLISVVILLLKLFEILDALLFPFLSHSSKFWKSILDRKSELLKYAAKRYPVPKGFDR